MLVLQVVWGLLCYIYEVIYFALVSVYRRSSNNLIQCHFVPGQGYCLCEVCTLNPLSALVSSHIPKMCTVGELMCLDFA